MECLQYEAHQSEVEICGQSEEGKYNMSNRIKYILDCTVYEESDKKLNTENSIN